MVCALDAIFSMSFAAISRAQESRAVRWGDITTPVRQQGRRLQQWIDSPRKRSPILVKAQECLSGGSRMPLLPSVNPERAADGYYNRVCGPEPPRSERALCMYSERPFYIGERALQYISPPGGWSEVARGLYRSTASPPRPLLPWFPPGTSGDISNSTSPSDPAMRA